MNDICISSVDTNRETRQREMTLLNKNNHHHKISIGFTGYNETCTGFNGPCWSLLVIGHLLLVAC